MASSDGKIQTVVVPLAPRPDVWQVLQTAIVFSALIAIWSGLRLYARRLRRMAMTIEDTMFFVSVGAFYGMIVALFLVLYLGGVGYHMDQLQKVHVARLTQSILAIQGMYGLSMCASKWSILWMLKRIFDHRAFRLAVWAVIIVQAAWMVMTLMIGLLICRPIAKNWDPTVEGSCGDQIAGYTAVSVYNVIVDVIMCILPLPMINRLQVKKPYKLALLGIFGIGIVTVIFSILRLFSLRSVDFSDFSYSVTGVIIWTYAETGVVILVACSPLLRPVFDKWFRRFLPSSAGRSSKGATGGSGYGHGTRGGGPGAGGSSHNHLNSATAAASRVKRRSRNGFMTMDDDSSDTLGGHDSLEMDGLGRTGYQTEVSSPRAAAGNPASRWRESHKAGGQIVMETQVVQKVERLG